LPPQAKEVGDSRQVRQAEYLDSACYPRQSHLRCGTLQARCWPPRRNPLAATPDHLIRTARTRPAAREGPRPFALAGREPLLAPRLASTNEGDRAWGANASLIAGWLTRAIPDTTGSAAPAHRPCSPWLAGLDPRRVTSPRPAQDRRIGAPLRACRRDRGRGNMCARRLGPGVP